MKRTSRRTFGKQLAGALVAVPLASHLVEAHTNDQQKRSGRRAQQKRSDDRVRSQFRSEHDTPPPGLLMGGSLVFEVFSEKTDWDADGPEVNGKLKWSVKPKPYDNGTSPTNIFIAHVKLVDGAGEMVFPTLNNEQKEPIEITTTLVKNGQAFGDCKLVASGDHFEIELPSSKRLKKKIFDNPANSRRQRVRYMHHSGFNPDQCEWVGVKIVKGGVTYYERPDLTQLPGYDETMRLMVWWENR